VNPVAAARRYPTLFALFAATVMIAQQVAGKAARDGLFLSHFDVVHLPKAVIAGALVSLVGVLLMSMLLTRFGPGRTVPAAFAASAVLFLLERATLDPAPGITAALLYLHMTGFGVIVISGFWSLVNERFDPHAAKPRIARIAAGATLGGVLGGLLARVVADVLGFPSMLVLLALLNLACAGLLAPLGAALREPARTEDAPVRSGLTVIARIPYLRYMAALLTLLAITAALLDFAFKSRAATHFVSREDLVAFFAGFYAVAGVVGFLLQSILGPRVLQRFGIGPALAALPAIIAAGSLLGSFAVTLTMTAILRGAHAVLGNSLFRSAFELLYAPLPPHAKRPTKTIIDVAADRVGDILGGGLVLALLALAPTLPLGVIVLLASISAGLALLLVARLNRGYVEQLAGTLRSGAVSLAEHEVLDATTRRILAETTAGAEREKVLERIKALRRDRAEERAPVPEPIYGGSSEALDPAPDAAPPRGETGSVAGDDRVALATADLASGDETRIRRALLGDFMDLRLVPHLITLLDHPRLAEDARMELRWLVPRVIGQLTDALLDPDQPLTVRQRLPGVMEICHSPRVVDGLLEGLADGEFSVRYSSTRALARMRSRDASLQLPTSTVHDAVRREVNVDASVWRNRALGTGADGGFDSAEGALGEEGASLSLDHVFTLLGLILDRDALQLALQALSSDNRNLRGTALEYLDNVLPEDLRRRLWQHLGITVSKRAPAAPRQRRPITGDPS
jgi:hypothetical protein